MEVEERRIRAKMEEARTPTARERRREEAWGVSNALLHTSTQYLLERL